MNANNIKDLYREWYLKILSKAFGLVQFEIINLKWHRLESTD